MKINDSGKAIAARYPDGPQRWGLGMIELAITDSERTLWAVTLDFLGVVVLIVVVVLLTILHRLVQRVDTNVAATWEMAKRVASNTATTWQLNGTAAVLKRSRREALIHDDFLSKKL